MSFEWSVLFLLISFKFWLREVGGSFWFLVDGVPFGFLLLNLDLGKSVEDSGCWCSF